MKSSLTGALFTIIGIFFFWVAHDYEIGSPSSMGPGFYPYYLSLFLIIIGILIVIKQLIWKS